MKVKIIKELGQPIPSTKKILLSTIPALSNEHYPEGSGDTSDLLTAKYPDLRFEVKTAKDSHTFQILARVTDKVQSDVFKVADTVNGLSKDQLSTNILVINWKGTMMLFHDGKRAQVATMTFDPDIPQLVQTKIRAEFGLVTEKQAKRIADLKVKYAIEDIDVQDMTAPRIAKVVSSALLGDLFSYLDALMTTNNNWDFQAGVNI